MSKKNIIYQRQPQESDAGIYFHIRVDDCGEEQLNLFKQKSSCVDWLIIGEIEEATTSEKQHYHTIIKFKYTVTRKRVIKDFVLNYKQLEHAEFNPSFGLIGGDYYVTKKYALSSVEQLINYAIKNGERYNTKPIKDPLKEEEIKDPLKEEKTKTKEPSKTNQCIRDIKELNEDGNFKYTLDELENKWESIFYLQTINKVIQKHRSQEIINIEGIDFIYISGDTGEGKSSVVKLLYPEIYKKLLKNKWWDGCKPNSEVWLDELDSFDGIRDMGGNEFFKNLGDINGMPVEFKGGMMSIRPPRLIITSNVTLQEFVNTIDTKKDKIDTRKFYQQMARRTLQIDIKDLLVRFELKCIKKDPITGIGGVFHISLIEEIENYIEKERLKYTVEVLKCKRNNTIVKKLRKDCKENGKKYKLEKRCISREILEEKDLLYEGSLKDIIESEKIVKELESKYHMEVEDINIY